ncbi:unnamed protein product [Boreogadus saida]
MSCFRSGYPLASQADQVHITMNVISAFRATEGLTTDFFFYRTTVSLWRAATEFAPNDSSMPNAAPQFIMA